MATEADEARGSPKEEAAEASSALVRVAEESSDSEREGAEEESATEDETVQPVDLHDDQVMYMLEGSAGVAAMDQMETQLQLRDDTTMYYGPEDVPRPPSDWDDIELSEPDEDEAVHKASEVEQISDNENKGSVKARARDHRAKRVSNTLEADQHPTTTTAFASSGLTCRQM